ncbi:MAG: ATP-binding cassette, subfamily er 3 [Acidimicrobiaceae bacterium]|nr:ATP-binding cassette, subfamily er 3 [Acidimicrobiaceae bacterium]
MITVSGLAKAHGAKQLFHDVTLRLVPGRRVALVGGNGTGKTTLLEIILGMQAPDGGEVHRGKDLKIGYLPQELTETEDGSVLDTVLGGVPELRELEHRLHHLANEVAATSGPAHDRALDELGDAQHRFETLGGYAIEAEAHRVLSGLGFAPTDSDRPLTELSGGWRMRAALARLLLAQPDVLVLDEPTNHLDTDSTAWLEDTLVAYSGALLFVSHDRDFIDAVAERVVELGSGTTTEYVGGFAEFVVQREERMSQLQSAASAQQKQIDRVERFVERFRYKATKARQVQSRVKTLEKLDRIELPDQRTLRARFAFPEPRRSSRVVAELTGVSVGYDGDAVLSGVDLVIERGQKLGLVGPNGAGKTTLLRLLLGELTTLAGTCTMGANVDIAYFAQHQVEQLNLGRTVLQEFQAAVGDAPRGRNLRTVLGSFGFPGDAAERRVGELSGGERTRLALGKIMVDPVNLLVLDEPTNHLDLASCDVLEDALRAYPGTVLLVSHDRYLIREVADGLIAVREGRARLFPGVDEEVLSGRRSTATAATPATKSTNERVARRVTAADDRTRRQDATKDLRKRIERLERDLGRAEAEVADLQRELSDPAIYDDHEKVRAVAERHDAAKDRAASLMENWVATHDELERVERRLG